MESLYFVIEMKNERIYELDKRLIFMEIVVCGWRRLGDVILVFCFSGIFFVICVEGRYFEKVVVWFILVLICYL